MKYKIGQILYRSDADWDTGVCELDKFMIRTIRGGFVYAIAKINGITWGKISTKSGDIGWLNPIDPVFRYRVPFGGKFNLLHTTKLKAWKSLLEESKKSKYFYSEEIKKKAITTCKRMIGKIKK